MRTRDATEGTGKRQPMKRLGKDEHGIIFEFIPRGSYVKVSAVDTRTGTEVSIVGDPMRGEAALRRVALRKLEYVMRRKTDAASGGRLA